MVEELSKLPGIGKRTALRLAIHMLRTEREDVAALAGAMTRFRNEVKYCVHCNNISDNDVCPICANGNRDRTTVCVVEHIKDVISVENTRQYNGMYHVLGGIISPMQGIAPSDLKIDLLVDNIGKGEIKEVILALNTSVEGETTSFYITRKLSQCEGIRITTLARGIGFGDELDYADELTIAHAIHNRRAL